MKMMKLFIAAVVLSTGLNLAAAEKKIWYKGAFEAAGSTKKTTSVNIIIQKDGTSKFIYAFKDAKSGPAYAQFPMFTDKNAATFEISIKGDGKKYTLEIWLEGKKGWVFQKRIAVSDAGKWQKTVIKLVGVKSTEAKYLRLLVPNKKNPASGFLMLKFPEYIHGKEKK